MYKYSHAFIDPQFVYLNLSDHASMNKELQVSLPSDDEKKKENFTLLDQSLYMSSSFSVLAKYMVAINLSKHL